MLSTFKNLTDEIVDKGLSPNQLYILLCLRDDVRIGIKNINSEVDELINKGYVTKDGLLSPKTIELFSQLGEPISKKASKGLSEEDKLKIVQYREIFPKGMLPSGQPSRVTIKELEKKFIWFLSNYDYSWETILKATEFYVESFRNSGFMYMKTSSYFISKSDRGTVTSTLATYCDMVLEGNTELQKPSYDSHTVV